MGPIVAAGDAGDGTVLTRHGIAAAADNFSRPRSSLEAVCLGETMTMVTPEQAESLEKARRLVLYPGGAESNVAMYLSSLGHRAAWVSRVGDDPLGRRIVAEVAREGVDTSLVEADPAAPTGVYFKDPGAAVTPVYYYRRHSAASLMGPELAEQIWRLSPRVLHVTGITPALSESCDQLIEALTHPGHRPTGVTVSFDVNFRPALWPSAARAADRLHEIAQTADVVFVGTDEALRLWGTSSPSEVRQLITRPRMLVVKEAAAGATAYDGHASTFVPAIKVTVIEPVGAGDAFAAGWLSGLLRGAAPAGRLRLGHLAASAALRSTADYARLPGQRLVPMALSATDEQWNAISSGVITGMVSLTAPPESDTVESPHPMEFPE
jgi:2-dehydro-3-deoxygluconokinase